MQENKLVDYHDILPGELTSWDIHRSRRFLEKLSPSELCGWTEDRTRVFATPEDRRFRMLVDHPLNGDRDKVVAVFPEFGTNLVPRLVAKSRIIRDTVAPEATLVIQPSSVVGEPNMNYSGIERRRLYKGDLQPIIGRIAITMDLIGNPSDVTIFGSSQGATIGLGYASHKNTPVVSLAALEIPNIVERDVAKLGVDFALSGRDLSQVVESNFENHEAPFAAMAEHDTTSLHLAQYVLRSLHLDNFAMVNSMCHATAIPFIEAALDKGSSIVHAWGDQDNVSPAYVNRYISGIPIFKDNPGYASRVLRGMGHSASDFYALDGALARLAHQKKCNLG